MEPRGPKHHGNAPPLKVGAEPPKFSRRFASLQLCRLPSPFGCLVILSLALNIAFCAGSEESSIKFSSPSTMVLSASLSDVEALNDSLPFPSANVTIGEHYLDQSGFGNKHYEDVLRGFGVRPIKKPRITVVYRSQIGFSYTVEEDDVICQSGPEAMTVSIKDTFVKNSSIMGNLLLHSSGRSSITSALPAVPLKVVNRALWRKKPAAKLSAGFIGTAVCLGKGERMEIVGGWPLNIPKFKLGPWTSNALVEQVFMTISNKSPQQYLMHAVLTITKAPSDGILEGQSMKKIPFVGYIALKSKFKKFEASLVRQKLKGKVCTLRRTKAHSVVELKCDGLEDAIMDKLKEVKEKSPKFRDLFKKVGALSALSAGSFAVGLLMSVLKNVHSEAAVLDPSNCAVVGLGSGALSLLTALFEGPYNGYKWFQWKKQVGIKTSEIIDRVLLAESTDPASKPRNFDMIFVVDQSDLKDKVGDIGDKTEEEPTENTKKVTIFDRRRTKERKGQRKEKKPRGFALNPTVLLAAEYFVALTDFEAIQSVDFKYFFENDKNSVDGAIYHLRKKILALPEKSGLSFEIVDPTQLTVSNELAFEVLLALSAEVDNLISDMPGVKASPRFCVDVLRWYNRILRLKRIMQKLYFSIEISQQEEAGEAMEVSVPFESWAKIDDLLAFSYDEITEDNTVPLEILGSLYVKQKEAVDLVRQNLGDLISQEVTTYEQTLAHLDTEKPADEQKLRSSLESQRELIKKVAKRLGRRVFADEEPEDSSSSSDLHSSQVIDASATQERPMFIGEMSEFVNKFVVDDAVDEDDDEGEMEAQEFPRVILEDVKD